ARDARRFEVEVVELGDAASGVDGQVRLEAPLDATLPRANDDARGALVDGEHLGVELHAHPEPARAPHEEPDEVRVEALQRSSARRSARGRGTARCPSSPMPLRCASWWGRRGTA